jgi:hypothetical protein
MLSMKWKRKSRIASLIAKLPSSLSYTTYYFFQRYFGGLGKYDPASRLATGIKVARYIHQQGQIIDDKTFLEIGTGPKLNLPLALWLLGASRIITVDLNPYLKAEPVFGMRRPMPLQVLGSLLQMMKPSNTGFVCPPES